MRCYFISNGRINAVAPIGKMADDAAIEHARLLFEKHKERSSGFEVWDRARLIYRYPVEPTETRPQEVANADQVATIFDDTK